MEIHLAIVDEDKRYASAFVDFAARTVGFAEPSAFSDAPAAIRAISRAEFDIILVEQRVGRTQGSDLIQQIKALRPNAHVLVLSSQDDDYLVEQAFSVGAEGYLLKAQPLCEVLAAIQVFYGGGVAVETGVLKRMLARLRSSNARNASLSSLTPRENLILGQLATGRSYKDIASGLEVSPHTVYSHSKRLFRKLGVRSKTEAVVRFLRPSGEPFRSAGANTPPPDPPSPRLSSPGGS